MGGAAVAGGDWRGCGTERRGGGGGPGGSEGGCGEHMVGAWGVMGVVGMKWGVMGEWVGASGHKGRVKGF